MSENILSTLTSPSDVKEEDIQKFVEQTNEPELSNKETENAIKDLYNKQYTKEYRKIDKLYCDPSVDRQDICLISFMPAKDARPNDSGIYGMVKVRGSFETDKLANDRAEFIIKNVDSQHKIFQACVGKPFPITDNRFYASERVQIHDTIEKIAAHNIQVYDEREKRELQEINKRKEEMMEEIERDETLLEQYITEKVKRANIVWTYNKCFNKMKELRETYQKGMKKLQELDEQDSELHNQYRQEYVDELHSRSIVPDPTILEYFEDENCLGTGIDLIDDDEKTEEEV